MPRPGRRRSREMATALVAWLLVIAALTLSPADGASASTARPFCLLCGDKALLDVVANVLLFVPLGLVLRGLGMAIPQVVAACLALSAAIEGLQFGVISGRDASLTDLFSNVLGGAVGAGLMGGLRTALNPSPIQARRMALGASLAWLLQVSCTSAVLHLEAPATVQYYGQWAPTAPRSADFPATVTSARIQDISVPPLPLERTDLMRQELSHDSASLQVQVTGLASRPVQAMIFVLTDGEGGTVASLEQRGCQLALVWRLRAETIGLRSPAVVAEHVCGTGDAQVTLTGDIARSQLKLSTTGSHATLPLTPNLGWYLLFPWDLASHLVLVGNMLWILGWFTPIAFWLSRATGGSGAGAAIAVGGTTMMLAAGVWQRHTLLPAEGFALLAAALLGDYAARVTVRSLHMPSAQGDRHRV